MKINKLVIREYQNELRLTVTYTRHFLGFPVYTRTIECFNDSKYKEGLKYFQVEGYEYQYLSLFSKSLNNLVTRKVTDFICLDSKEEYKETQLI